MTATMYASERGHEGCLQLLIAAGANMDKQDRVCECDLVPGATLCSFFSQDALFFFVFVFCCFCLLLFCWSLL